MAEEKKNVEQQASEEVEKNKDVEAINRIIRGKNDVFEKTYNLAEIGREFTIKVKAPNAIEQAKIHAKTSLYFDGLGRFMSDSLIRAYTALATIRVCGIEVPDFLQNDEDIYNMNILILIGEDITEWLDSFRY